MKQSMHLAGRGEFPISRDAGDLAPLRLTGRQELALLRLLERHCVALEYAAEAERDREYGRGPGAFPAEIPHKIKKGDERIGKRAISYNTSHQRSLDGKVTAILRYSNGVEQIEITQKVYALDSNKPGTAVAWVHADDVDIL